MPDLQAEDKKSAYSLMLQHLADNGIISKDLILSSLQALQIREDKMTTAMGGGFALPHATIPKLPSLCTLLARSPKGVPCEAMDGKLVSIFFLFSSRPIKIKLTYKLSPLWPNFLIGAELNQRSSKPQVQQKFSNSSDSPNVPACRTRNAGPVLGRNELSHHRSRTLDPNVCRRTPWPLSNPPPHGCGKADGWKSTRNRRPPR